MIFLFGCTAAVQVSSESQTAVESEDETEKDSGEVMEENLGQGEITPSITVTDQEVLNSNINVFEVVALIDGFIVIHADSGDGTPGPVIGNAQVEQGTSNNVSVQIDETKATSKLFAMLHVDTGALGSYEFPDADGPVKVNGAVLVKSFNATNIAAPEPDPTLPETEPEPEPEPVAGLKEFRIEADDSGFYDESGSKITNLELNNGDEVKITFFVRKTGVYFAGLKFKGPDFDSGALDKEEEYVVEFIASDSHKIKSYWPAKDRLKATLNINVN